MLYISITDFNSKEQFWNLDNLLELNQFLGFLNQLLADSLGYFKNLRDYDDKLFINRSAKLFFNHMEYNRNGLL